MPNKKKQSNILWIHAVSAGEIASTKKLIHILSQDFFIFLSCSTLSGYTMGQKTFQKLRDLNQLNLGYFPFDYPFMVKRMLRNIKPQGIIFIEGEIWPNFVVEASKQKIPLFLISARLGSKEFKGYQFLSILFKPILELYSLISTQTEVDRERFLQLKLPEQKLRVGGNLKFDFNPDQSQVIESKKCPILLSASTHEGEEKLYLEVFQHLVRIFPLLKLVLAPRNLNRVDQVEKLCHRFGFSIVKLTCLAQSDLSNFFQWDEPKILLLDTLGDLIHFYPLCDVVLLGGSFNPKIGGHNFIEPMSFKKPVIVGPHNKNWEEFVSEFLKHSALIQVSEQSKTEEMVNWIQKLLTDKKLQDEIINRGESLLKKHLGASQRSVDWIRNIL